MKNLKDMSKSMLDSAWVLLQMNRLKTWYRKSTHIDSNTQKLCKAMSGVLSIAYENNQGAKGLQAMMLDENWHLSNSTSQKIEIVKILNEVHWKNEQILGDCLDLLASLKELYTDSTTPGA